MKVRKYTYKLRLLFSSLLYLTIRKAIKIAISLPYFFRCLRKICYYFLFRNFPPLYRWLSFCLFFISSLLTSKFFSFLIVSTCKKTNSFKKFKHIFLLLHIFSIRHHQLITIHSSFYLVYVPVKISLGIIWVVYSHSIETDKTSLLTW